MGRNHLRALAASTHIKVTAIAEPVESTRRSLQSSDIHLYADLDQMLDSAAIDAVLVCVPSDKHLATVKRLVSAGMPTLCEKPVGVTASDAEQASALVAAAGLPFQVGFWRRFVPILKDLRDRIAQGKLGDIYAVANFQWDGEPPSSNFRAHSGGIFIDMGVYEFDQTRWLVGQEFGPITSLASGVAGEPWPGDPESAHAMAELSGGGTVLVSLGRRFPLGDVCKVEVFGTRDWEDCRFLWPPTADETFFEALRAQAESFARYARGGPREGAGGADAVAALEAASRAVQVVDVCTPRGTHAEIASAAAQAGKAVICEKPLAVTHAQAAAAAGAVRRAGVLNAVGFNYRRLPAVSLMKRMVDEGAVGKVRLVRGSWLSDEFVDPTIPFDWRFDRSMGGSTIADLGSHLIDMATWMAGPVDEVSGQSETFVRERSQREVTVDDASSALVRFASGARGVFEMARTAVRRPCDLTLEVNGDRGTLVFEYARLNELLYGDGQDRADLYGMRRIRAEHSSHPYAKDWWPIGQGVGYGSSFVNHLGDLLERWPEGPWDPGFAQGAAVQAVGEAIERSAAERRWVRVAEVTAEAPPAPPVRNLRPQANRP